MEIVLAVLSLVAAFYLLTGLTLFVWLPHRLFSEEVGARRLLLRAPGAILYWPVLLMRRASRPTSNKTDRGGEVDHEPTNPIGVWLFLSLTVLPVFLIVSPYAAGPEPAPYFRAETRNIIAGGSPERVRVDFGEIFPGYAASFQLCKGAETWGFQVIFDPAKTMAPANMFWAESLDSRGRFPESAEFLGTVAGPNRLWIPLPRTEMRYSGYWILHHFQSDLTEVYEIAASFKENFEGR